MEKLRGSDVHEPYCALSYSWNQSGEISNSDDGQTYTRTDNGKHKIITYREKRGGDKNAFKTTTRLVKFEGLIQQICQDFDIGYIWYDQMCIDQNNPEEKRREIRQMHKIYSSAQCTVVLVPEFHMRKEYAITMWKDNVCYIDRYTFPHYHGAYGETDEIRMSEWSKRMWTLEEAFLSRSLLFIGENTYQRSILEIGLYNNFGSLGVDQAFLFDIYEKSQKWTASTILWHARRRTSSKLHDRIFALANLLPEIAQELSFDYSQPLLDTMLHFYRLLAQKDLSILCFGVPDEGDVSFRQPGYYLPGQVPAAPML